MEDFKILLYVFGIVIYIIYMAMRKYFNPEQEQSDQPPRSASRPRPRQDSPLPEAWPSERVPEKRAQTSAPAAPPPPTFEEMMRRLGKPVEEDKAFEKAQEKVEEIRSKAEKARDLIKRKVTDYIRPENRAVVNYEEDPRKLLDLPEPPSRRVGREQPPVVHPYAALLQNSRDARAAFVLTQIFERKEW
jgi:hypothetical protein